MKTLLVEALAALSAGEVDITFMKVSGEITTRRATTNLDLVPQELHPKESTKKCADCVQFYSITDSAWRCFKVLNLIDFVVIEKTIEQTIWITEWNKEGVKIVDRLGTFVPTWVPRNVISQMELIERNDFFKVYIYKVQVERKWWAENIHYYGWSQTGYFNNRRGFRSDD
jgi:hypothetical protein